MIHHPKWATKIGKSVTNIDVTDKIHHTGVQKSGQKAFEGEMHHANIIGNEGFFI